MARKPFSSAAKNRRSTTATVPGTPAIIHDEKRRWTKYAAEKIEDGKVSVRPPAETDMNSLNGTRGGLFSVAVALLIAGCSATDQDAAKKIGAFSKAVALTTQNTSA